MKHKIYASNFKCFKRSDQLSEIELSNLTICSGMNSVGKSTLIQSILLLRQTADRYKILNNANAVPDRKKSVNVLLNTSSLNLGSTAQIMSTKEAMFLGLDAIGFTYLANEDYLSLEVVACDCNKKLPESEFKSAYNMLYKNNFYYLNAERLGPRNYQGITSHSSFDNCCGINGEYTFDVIASYSQNSEFDVSEKRRFIYDSTKRVKDLDKQIEYWLGYIANGVQVQFSSNLISQTANMQVQQPDSGASLASPYNFGFGISYVLPIITTCLVAEPNSTIIIENPEAHLHPAGQSRIGRFLSQISQDNINVIVETHSEHIINGARIYALQNEIDPDDICINYFSINENKGHLVERLTLDNKMNLNKWPAGFFDQEEKDLGELIKLRGKRNENEN